VNAEGAKSSRRCLFEQEEGRVQPNPHNVNEVPVVTHALKGRELARVTLTAAHAKEQEGHGDETEEHVQTVQARGDEKDRAVGVGVPTRRQVRPLVGLVDTNSVPMIIVVMIQRRASARRRCSINHTAHCMVNDEATKMIVKMPDCSTSSLVPTGGHAARCARIVKRAAKSPEKNISSLPSQIITPMASIGGRS
jgi:hypothetical protein